MTSGQPIDREKVKGRRVKHEKRLTEEAWKFREAAEASPGMARELLLKRARQAETALHLNEWLNFPGLQPRGA